MMPLLLAALGHVLLLLLGFASSATAAPSDITFVLSTSTCTRGCRGGARGAHDVDRSLVRGIAGDARVRSRDEQRFDDIQVPVGGRAVQRRVSRGTRVRTTCVFPEALHSRPRGHYRATDLTKYEIDSA